MNLIKKYKYYLVYLTIMLAIGIWQLLDWYLGTEDPIWHLVFYFYIIPILSFLFGLTIKKGEKSIWIPFTSYLVTIFIYTLMENGGLSFNKEILLIGIIPFSTSFLGVIIKRIITKK